MSAHPGWLPRRHLDMTGRPPQGQAPSRHTRQITEAPWVSGTSPQHQPRLGKIGRRLIGSIRREYVNQFVVLGEAHLREILRAYARYCNDIRTHRSLDKTRRSLVWFSGPESSRRTSSSIRPGLGTHSSQNLRFRIAAKRTACSPSHGHRSHSMWLATITS